MQLTVHSFIRPYLQGSEFDGDSKTLADFISLMLKNNKSQEQIIHELSEIIGPEVAKELTDEMFSWIKNNSIDVHVELGSTRILGAALKQATAEPVLNQKRSRDEDVQEPKKALKITDRLGPSISERLGKKEKIDILEQESSRQKCSFWPNCKKSDCPFIHPTTMCQYGESCTKGDRCTFIHMSDLKGKKDEKSTLVALNTTNSTMIACKFASSCLKPDCPFGHPSAPTIALNQPSKSSIECKFDPGCLKPLCPYSHPSKLVAQNNDISTMDFSSVQCKYDPFCTRVGCLFKHSPKDITLRPSKKFMAESNQDSLESPIIITSPNGSAQPAPVSNTWHGRFKNKSLILNAPHVSQRGFAVSEQETEKFKMNVE